MQLCLFWNVTQRRFAVIYGRFGTVNKETWHAWPFKIGPIGFPETSVTYHPLTLRNAPEERRFCMYWCLYWRFKVSDRISSSRFVARTKAVHKMCANSHGSLHKRALVVKRMPYFFKSVSDNGVQTVHSKKTLRLNFRLLKLLCIDSISNERRNC